MTSRRGWMMMAAALAACSPAGPATFTVGGTHLDGGASGSDAASRSETAARDAIPVADRGTSVIAQDAACATTTANAARLPVNLLIVLDRSGSMMDGTPTSKWDAAVAGLRQLLARLDPDVRVGITLFPADGSGAGSATTYATPNVPVGPLSSTRSRIEAALAASGPNGNTPMNCALEGTNSYYGGFTMDGSRNVILITDGQPTEECTTAPPCGLFPPDFACILNQARVASDAVRVTVARGARGTPPIRFFIAGTPDASDAFLSDLAFTGNSARTPGCQAAADCHYQLGTSTFGTDLQAALDDIRGRALTCEFAVDADPSRVDPTRVNVDVTPSGAATPTLVPRDTNHANGWDYSDGMRSVILYGAACSQVMTDPGVRVQILFGCPTVTPG